MSLRDKIKSLAESWEVRAEAPIRFAYHEQHAADSAESETYGRCAEALREVLAAAPAPVVAPATALATVTAQKDAAYAERNQVVALLARMAVANGWRAGLRAHEPDPDPTWDHDWKNVVAIDLPTGQVTWHYHDSDRPLFASLPPYTGSWDGHDTAEKYRRVNAALAAAPLPVETPRVVARLAGRNFGNKPGDDLPCEVGPPADSVRCVKCGYDEESHKFVCACSQFTPPRPVETDATPLEDEAADRLVAPLFAGEEARKPIQRRAPAPHNDGEN